MATAPQFFPYSQIQHIGARDLLCARSQLIEAIFPAGMYPAIWDCHVASFFLCVGNTHMLVLADSLSFASIRNPGEYFSEVCPVLFDKASRSCDPRLLDLIKTKGVGLPDLPKMVAFQILDTKMPAPPCNPHERLCALLEDTESNVRIGPYSVSQLHDTWQPHPDFSDWKGIVFEQSLQGGIEGPLRVWLHEKNPKAAQRAIESADADVKRLEASCKELGTAVQREESKQNPKQASIARIKDNLRLENERLEDAKRFLAKIKERGVTSSKGSTFQAEAKVLINNAATYDLLMRHLIKESTCLIRTFYLESKWNFKIDVKTLNALESLSQRGKNFLFKGVKYLRSSGKRTGQDWDFFYEHGLMAKRAWLIQTNADYKIEYQSRNQAADLTQIDAAAQENARKKLCWVMGRVNLVSEALKGVGAWDELVKDVKILKQFNSTIRSVARIGGLRRSDVEEKLDLHDKWITGITNGWKEGNRFVLFKRVSNGGHIEFGPARYPVSGITRGVNPIETRDGVHLLMHDVRF